MQNSSNLLGSLTKNPVVCAYLIADVQQYIK